MLKIYGSDLSAPANKVRFAANHLGLKYEYVKVNLREGEHRKPEFLKINPAGKVPAIDDDGFVLFESNAIIKYLAAKTESDLYPDDLKQRALIDQWTDFSTIHVGAAVNRVVFNRVFVPLIGAEIDERSLKDGLAFLEKFLPVVDRQLQDHAYLAGESMTVADLTLLAFLDPAEAAQIDLTPYPSILQWRNQLKEQPFYTTCHRQYGEALKKIAGK